MFCSTSATEPKGPNNIVIQRAGVVHIHNHYYAGRSHDSESEDSKKRLAEWKAASEADRQVNAAWTSPVITDEGQRQAEEAMRRATEYYKERSHAFDAALSAPGAREANSGGKILCPTENLQKRLRACLQAGTGDEASEDLDDEELEDEFAALKDSDNNSDTDLGYDTDLEDPNIADNKESKEPRLRDDKVSEASQAAASTRSDASRAPAAVAKVAKPSAAKGG